VFLSRPDGDSSGEESHLPEPLRGADHLRGGWAASESRREEPADRGRPVERGTFHRGPHEQYTTLGV